MKMNVSISGLNKMQKELLSKVDPAEIRKVVLRNAAQLQANAQRRAPVSTEKTNPGANHGQLQRSINLRTADNEAVIKATMEYAEYVELGTRFMDAQPYMKPAFDEQKPKFLRDLKKVIAK